MKHYPPPSSRPRTPPRQIPPFHAVPVRIRTDGWTPLRQAEFVGMLAQTRSVAAAARFVGMGREGAYRLRARAERHPGAEGFCAAWDAAVAPLGSASGRALYLAAQQLAAIVRAPSRKATLADLQWRVETGLWHVILRGGRYAGVRKTADNEALLMLLRRAVAFSGRTEEAA
jgi:hypothetical protein